MKQRIIAIVLFVVVLVFPIVSWPIVKNYENTQINENRELAPAPQQFGNDYFEQVDNYFNDHAPYRNFLIKFHNDIERSFNKFYENFLNMFHIPYYTAVNDVLFGKDDWLFYLAEDNMDYYLGSNLPSQQDLELMVARAEKVNNYFKSQGKDFLIFIAPNKEQIYSEYLPTSLEVKSEIKRLDMIYSYFKQHSSVKIVFPKEELIEAKEQNQLYYKQDTHWNNYGGYIGAISILQSLGIKPAPANITQTSINRGDLANKAVIPLIDDVEYLVEYRPEYTLTNLGNIDDARYICSNPNGKELFYLGDSFRYAMREILAKEFSYSTIMHQTKFVNKDSFIDEIATSDTIIFECLERYDYKVFGDDGTLQRMIDFYNL